MKNWNKYEIVFEKLIEADQDPVIGTKRFFQAVILFFIRCNPGLKNQAPTFCKLLYDTEFITDEFVTIWHSGKGKLDKNSCLYDKKAETQFRILIEEFVLWLG